MKPVLLAGTLIVNLALISYTVAVLTQQRRRAVTPRVRLFLTAGVLFDITATACMILGSSQSPFTLHGILGYSSLTAMTIDMVLLWQHYFRSRLATVPPALHLYSRLAYFWWLAAYVTGTVLVAVRH